MSLANDRQKYSFDAPDQSGRSGGESWYRREIETKSVLPLSANMVERLDGISTRQIRLEMTQEVSGQCGTADECCDSGVRKVLRSALYVFSELAVA
jgi:hypothetical protein